MSTARRSPCCAAFWKRSRARLRRPGRPRAVRRTFLHAGAAMSGDRLEPRRRVAVREALAAKRNVVAVVRKRRRRLRWIAGVSLLTWFPLGALAQLANIDVGVWAWAAGAALAAGGTAVVYAIEGRARARLRTAV